MRWHIVRSIAGLGNRATLAQSDDLPFEIVRRTELLVHRGEPEISDFVEVLKRAQDGQTDLVGRDLGCAPGPYRVLHLLREPPERVFVH